MITASSLAYRPKIDRLDAIRDAVHGMIGAGQYPTIKLIRAAVGGRNEAIASALAWLAEREGLVLPRRPLVRGPGRGGDHRPSAVREVTEARIAAHRERVLREEAELRLRSDGVKNQQREAIAREFNDPPPARPSRRARARTARPSA